RTGRWHFGFEVRERRPPGARLDGLRGFRTARPQRLGGGLMLTRRHYADPVVYRRIELEEITAWFHAHGGTPCRAVSLVPTMLLLSRVTENARLGAAVQRYWEKEAAWIERHQRKFPHRTWWRSEAPAA